jgi:hypothetical protein
MLSFFLKSFFIRSFTGLNKIAKKAAAVAIIYPTAEKITDPVPGSIYAKAFSHKKRLITNTPKKNKTPIRIRTSSSNEISYLFRLVDKNAKKKS